MNDVINASEVNEALKVKKVARKDNDFNSVTIRDGRIYGLTLSYHFQVKISESENPGICPRVNCDGMPVEVLCKKAWDALKVSGRPVMKTLSSEALIKGYHNKEIEWQVMASQEYAQSYMSSGSLDNDQLDREIARLQALKSKEDK